MKELVLTKSSSESDLKRYFTAVLELSKSDNKFPINLDEVWMLVYERRDKAFNALRRHFYEGEDFYLTQMGKVVTFKELKNGIKVECHLSVSCLEYFIARKVRPVFEVYRQVFHKTANPTAALLPLFDCYASASQFVQRYGKVFKLKIGKSREIKKIKNR